MADLAQERIGVTLAAGRDAEHAEPMLIAGYEGMLRHRAALPPSELRYVDDAAHALVQLYKTTGNAQAATEWSRKQATRR